jgi:hypothetical protein
LKKEMAMQASVTQAVEADLRKGFYGESVLRIVRRLGDARHQNLATNPIAFYAVESVLTRIYSRWLEQQPSTVPTGIALETHLIPPIEAVLRAADGQPAELVAALNALVRAYDAALSDVPVDTIAG